MTTRTDEDPPSPASNSRMRFELIFASAWLAVGLFVVPALVYWVGLTLLGPYGEQAGMAAFYGAFFADLASLTARTWMLALGPLLLISVVRLIYVGVARPGSRGKADEAQKPANRTPPAKPIENRRVEPRIGG